MKKVKTIVVIMCLAVGLMATGLFAAIVGTTGDIVEVTPPSSVLLGAVESNTQVIVFQEQGQLQLTSNIDVDISSPGTYFPSSTLSPWTIPADTLISGSYFLHFDAAAYTGYVTVDGSVTFECPIIGVSILTQQIDNSDSALGASGTTYPTGMWPNRGLTFEEYVTLSADMMTLSMHLEIDETVDPNLDQIRVVTMCEPFCGDGILDEGEECDDGNNVDGDGCSATCTVEDEGDGCTPGYWKNHLSSWAPTGLSPADDFDTTFGVDFFDPDITLEEAVNLKGGGIRKIARHGTAALLNALHPDVNYPLSASEVIAAVQATDLGGIVDFNELSDTCPAE
jgi:cysteine-rich repeat protein